MILVVDASAVLPVLLGDPTGLSLGQRLFDPAHDVRAPHLIDVEVAHTLRREALKGRITAPMAERGLEDLMDLLPLSRHGHSLLLPRIWRLRGNLTAYDATYVALAEHLDATLLTRDAKLASAPGHHVRIELV